MIRIDKKSAEKVNAMNPQKLNKLMRILVEELESENNKKQADLINLGRLVN